MIVLFTDFGLDGPYIGQMKVEILKIAPAVPVIDLFADLAPFDPRSAAYVIPAYTASFPEGTVFLCIVDPGVGGPRRPLVQRSRGHWFVGPDNGLFDVEAGRDAATRRWEIAWRPTVLSASFHGRDLFAPVAARLAMGDAPEVIGCNPIDDAPQAVPPDLPRIVYMDRFGNAVTGIRASTMSPTAELSIRGFKVPRANTFSDVEEGMPFWYENANGLVEIAVNRGYADEELQIEVGDPFVLHLPRRRRKPKSP
ncbi:MAG: SAM-dependent chlorinase/fluorinase [Gammaproteobacteria bacterium]